MTTGNVGAAGAATIVLARAVNGPDQGEGDAMLARAVSGLTGLDPAAVQLGRACPRCGSGRHGRPVVIPGSGRRRPWVSLARCDGLVVVAASTSGPVGIDVERREADRFDGVGSVVRHPRETDRSAAGALTTWVRKESLLKATGDGLDLDPRSVRLAEPDTPPELLEWPAPGGPRHVWMQDLAIEGHVACLTVLARRPSSVRLSWETEEGPARPARP